MLTTNQIMGDKNMSLKRAQGVVVLLMLMVFDVSGILDYFLVHGYGFELPIFLFELP